MASPGTDLTRNTIREGGSAVGSYTLPPGRPTRSRGCVLTLPLEWLKRLRHLSSTSPASCGPRSHGALVPGVSPAFVGNGCGQGQAGGIWPGSISGWSSRAEIPETISKLGKEAKSAFAWFAILVSAGEASTVLALTEWSSLSPPSAPTSSMNNYHVDQSLGAWVPDVTGFPGHNGSEKTKRLARVAIAGCNSFPKAATGLPYHGCPAPVGGRAALRLLALGPLILEYPGI
ncbi:hypothetical protein EDB80DRAFT_723302 [Ilyonectria destructans]|nr:hypothetical protein EDB80DRAFT_723302 [Ilyonectria destructans]